MSWATVAELKEFTQFHDVETRRETELQILIDKWELYIKAFCGQTFEDAEDDVLADLKVLVCSLVERDVMTFVSRRSQMMGFKSESIGDWSYSFGDGGGILKENGLTGDAFIDVLLEKYAVGGKSRGYSALIELSGPTRYADGTAEENIDGMTNYG